jgi:hypothetical protein
VLVLAGGLVRLGQLQTFKPLSQGYDAYSHIDYVMVARDGRLPALAELWQAYQPPGYYVLSGRLSAALGTDPVSTAQAVSALSSLLIVVPGFLLARRLTPGWEPLVVLVLVFLPGSLRTAPMVYNQQLATLAYGVFLLFLQSAWSRPPTLRSEAALGIAWGLALLVRWDALCLALPVALLALARLRQQRGGRWWEVMAGAVLTGMIALSMLSPLLLRNLGELDKLLVTNRDPMLYPYHIDESIALPSFLHPRTLVDPGLDLWREPGSLSFESLPMFLLGNLWGADMISSPWLGRGLLLLGLAVTVLASYGCWQIAARSDWQPVLAVAAGSAAIMAMLVLLQPDFTNYKACYFHGAYYLLALATATGAAHWRGTRRAAVIDSGQA